MSIKNVDSLTAEQVESMAMKPEEEITVYKNTKFHYFKSLARPFILWVMGFSLLYYYIVAPMLHSLFGVYGLNYALPIFDQTGLSTLLIALLGSSALRTFEKYKSIQDNH